MANPYTQGSESIEQAEHVSPGKTGDNVEAKKTVGYVWNPATSLWERDTSAGVALTVRIDDATTADVTYLGKAAIGTATSAAGWQIAKLSTASGLIKTWADGNVNFDNVWDNRASLSYS